MTAHLTPDEKLTLLKLARETIELAVRKKSPPPLDFKALSPHLREPGMCFVTLTLRGTLRGCVGGIEVRQPLAADVREHALAAAFHDYRFPPLQPEELRGLEIEISVLATPHSLDYTDADDLVRKLRPGVDGVIISDGLRRATFLPQVWEKAPDPAFFLDMLCEKMGAPAGLWRVAKLQVKTYEVEEFREGEIH